MSVTSHIDALQTKHHAIDERIEFAYSHHFNDTDVARMKKEKLRLKDQIQREQTRKDAVA